MIASTILEHRAALLLVLVLARTGMCGDVLPANPGLDGGKGGHWGLKNDKHWGDNRWNEMDVGPVMSCTLGLPGFHVLKSTEIKIGEQSEGAVCFDTTTLSMRAGWTGKFIKFAPARWGLIQFPQIDGTVLFSVPGSKGWGATGKYGGLYLHGKRVVLTYNIDSTGILESPWIEHAGGVTAISRTFNVEKADVARACALAEMDGAQIQITQVEGLTVALIEKGEKLIALGIAGNAGAASLVAIPAGVSLSIAPHAAAVRVKTLVWSGPKADLPKFAALLKGSAEAEDLKTFCGGGPARWGEPLKTQGSVSTEKKAYVIDTITLPYENPYKALLFLSGHDFFENGDAAVCSLHGDVWIVSGIDDKLKALSWRRFATGLYQPLGLKIVKNKVYVVGRDQITLLHDLNTDGEADFYQNFNNDCSAIADGHDYSACLETDSAGNFYHVNPRGLHRISADGSRYETLATGWRNPVSMTIGPADVITVSPQEGEWTPASMICEVKAGGYYGFGGPKSTPERPLGYDPPLCYVPRQLDNSTGGHVWATGDRFGPLSGQLLNLSFGQCAMHLVLREVIGGQSQGGVVPLNLRFMAGVMRGRVRASDGQLYLTGTQGWVSSALRDGCFQRVRYTGARICLPVGLNIHANGIRISFSEALSREAADDAESYSIEQWNYKYSSKYGSAEYAVSQPEVIGHESAAIKSAKLAADGRSVFLEVPGLQSVMQMRIKYLLKDATGENARGEINNTIHWLGPAYQP